MQSLLWGLRDRHFGFVILYKKLGIRKKTRKNYSEFSCDVHKFTYAVYSRYLQIKFLDSNLTVNKFHSSLKSYLTL
jgi:hypothetical protein